MTVRPCRRDRSRPLAALYVAAASSVAAGAPPTDFVRSPVATGLNQPTVIEFLPDGRMLIGERAGTIRLVVGGQLQPQPVVQIPGVFTDGDVGLLCIAADPDFGANNYFYVYYTFNDASGTHNRVGRFTMTGNAAPLGSEVVIWQNPELCEGSSHHGGSIAFGNDGNLLIPTGDQFNSDNAQSLSTQHGKILRIHPDGSVPADNPFLGDAGVPPVTWALGTRNPFRSTVDRPTGRFYIGDVGLNTWEEIDRPTAGSNLGWPFIEGPQCYVPDCSSYLAPIKAYNHNDPAYTGTLYDEQSAAIVLGPVYRGSVFPAEYAGNLFFGDYVNGWIRRLVLDASGNVTGESVFDSSPDAGTIVDLKVGPDGALYGVDIFGGPYGPAVFKIAYAPGANQPPIPRESASPLTGLPPLDVTFTGDTSTDPDDGPGPLTYFWDFGDGQTSTAANPVHTYEARGNYQVRLAVSDSAAQSTAAPIQVLVGNIPVPVIDQPTAGTTYSAGDAITFNGHATDVEDGALPDSALRWSIYLLHVSHLHPFLGPLTGRGGEFFVPTSGHPPEHTRYLIRLTVRDSDGLPAAVTRIIDPVVSDLHFASTPPGIPVFIDTGPLATPSTYGSLVGFHHNVSAQPSFVLSNRLYSFASWSQSAERSFVFNVPPGGASLTVRYVMACPGDWDGDGALAPSDIALFVNDWFAALINSTLVGDYDGDGIVAPADVAALVQDWFNSLTNGC